MCGIAGYSLRHSNEDPNALARMAAALRHRGPDSEGFHRRGSNGMAVRRLRVIDLVTGDQPITSLCTDATIVYNGELYNYRELRAGLQERGHRFRTESDTEVVLHFYEEYGVEAFPRLNGMFAFAIDDPRNDRLVVARDQLGVKPLYYATPTSGDVIFASEPKALLVSGTVNAEVDRAGLSAYLAYGHSAGERTVYLGIRKLPPGHALVVDTNEAKLVRWWDLLTRARRWESGSLQPLDELEALICDAVRRNMISDVPVGAFLSGGLDSSLVTSLMRRDTDHVRTYSVGFDRPTDELGDAQRVADRLGTAHTAILVTAKEAAAALDDVVRIYDEPFADAAALPTLLMAKRARADVTVVLTGEGGDEVFGGYRRYVAEQASTYMEVVPHGLRHLASHARLERAPRLRRLGRSIRALAESERTTRFITWTELFDKDERRALLGETANEIDDPTPLVPPRHIVRDNVNALMMFELRSWLADAYLEKVDKATMCASLEARVPLLDPRIVEFMALAPRRWKIDGLNTKTMLRRIAGRYLPPQTIRKPKQGFGPPVGAWLNTTFRERVDEVMAADSALAGFVDVAAVRRIVLAHRRGQWRDAQVWALLVLGVWAEARRYAPVGMAATV